MSTFVAARLGLYSSKFCFVQFFVLCRFLCKIKQAAILESLIPAIIANLDHRHSYVRKNAVLCVYSIFEFSPEMVEDAPTLIEQFLATVFVCFLFF